MKNLIVIGSAVLLSGCQSFGQMVAHSYNMADPCQTRAELNRPQGYQMPDWCYSAGPGLGARTIYNRSGSRVGYISR